MTNKILDRTGAPPYLWLQCLLYVCFLLNFTACAALAWQTPMRVLTGTTPDISPLLQFHFFEEVAYTVDNAFPSESPEATGWWVGPAPSVGHALTHKILTKDTQRIIYRSAVCSL